MAQFNDNLQHTHLYGKSDSVHVLHYVVSMFIVFFGSIHAYIMHICTLFVCIDTLQNTLPCNIDSTMN